MRKFLNVLKKCILFNNVKEEEIPGILSCLGARVTDASKGEYIFAEGEPAKYVGIVLSGGVQIVKNDFFGNRSIVDSIGTAELFGESFACADVETLPVDAVASEDSEILLIDCRRIITTCNRNCEFHNKIIYNMLHVVANKNLIFNKKIDIISKRTTREKLMAYLLSQAKLHNSNSFTISFDRQALADYLCVERSAMSAELSRMRQEGLVDYKRSWFKVVDKGI